MSKVRRGLLARRIRVLVEAALLVALVATCAGAAQREPTPARTGAQTRAAPPPGFRVAFIGDQGLGEGSRRVLQLIRDEGAQMLLHLGDFDYEDDPVAWDAELSEVLGHSFPVFAVVGNHDVHSWDAYRHLLVERLARVEGAVCQGDYGVNAACTYRGLFFILSGVGTLGSDHASFLEAWLARDASVWSVCAWHKNQRPLQVGEKNNAVGWGAYEECRKGGAIVATAHEHSYQRTKTLSHLKRQSVDRGWKSADELRVGGGSTFVFVSGLGGKSIRGQDRCHPVSPPYGCNQEWARIYTSDQGAKYGALFIEFNVDSDTHKARGYFKNLDGEVIDRFTVVAEND